MIASLQQLSLRASSVGDSATPLLVELASLNEIDLRDTHVTAAGIERLRNDITQLAKIIWNDRENDRAVAARLSNKNATIEIKTGRIKQKIQPGDSLPSVPFRIVSINAEEKEGLTTADFEGVETLDALESIDMLYTRLDDSVLATLKGLTELKNLSCVGTAMKGEVLAQFETCRNLGASPLAAISRMKVCRTSKSFPI